MIGNFGFIKMDKNAISSETNMILRALVKTNQKYKIIGGLKKILFTATLQSSELCVEWSICDI